MQWNPGLVKSLSNFGLWLSGWVTLVGNLGSGPTRPKSWALFLKINSTLCGNERIPFPPYSPRLTVSLPWKQHGLHTEIKDIECWTSKVPSSSIKSQISCQLSDKFNVSMFIVVKITHLNPVSPYYSQVHWLTHQKGVYQFRYFLPQCIYQILLLSAHACMHFYWNEPKCVYQQ